MSLEKMIFLDEAFDSQTLKEEHAAVWPDVAALIAPMMAQDWVALNQVALSAFSKAQDVQAKVYILQWGVAAAEARYDLSCRSMWMSLWDELPFWASDLFCCYLRTFQGGVTAFFSGSLREAESRFRRAYTIALAMKYRRGQMRSLFHVGLTLRDCGRSKEAIDFFQQSLKIAQEADAELYLKRIRPEISRLQEEGVRESGFEKAKDEIEKLILAGDFGTVRFKLAQSESKRRQMRFYRKRESLYAYLPLVLMGLGKTKAAERLLRKNFDPILKIKVLEMAQGQFGLKSNQSDELSFLKEVHGVSRVVHGSLSGNEYYEISGVSLDSVGCHEVQALVRLLMKRNGPVNKEEICQEVWNFSYDPVAHDGRIYKLFHRARNLLGKKELFVNRYGGLYEINPKFLGKPELKRRRVS